MPNTYFQFKQFIIHQDRCAMKVTTDGCLFGAWVADKIRSQEFGVGSKILNVRRCLDVGTGTGLLALMLAQKNEQLHIDAIEIDKQAAMQATENVQASAWNSRVKVINEDASRFRYNQSYDLIISNPPFYENELKSPDAQKNAAHHSDELKLENLIEIITTNLSAAGQFYILLPVKREVDIKNLLVKNNLEINEMVFVRQSVQHDFFRIMIAGKKKEDEIIPTILNELAIKDEQQNYTTSFSTLLKDYYLHL